MNNKIITIIVSVIAIFGFLFLVYKLTNAPQNTVYPEVNKILQTDHLKWSSDKKNLLVEYSDLQCPSCKVFHDLIQTEIEASGSANSDMAKKITLIYRHYPLTLQHQNSEKAAYAAEAAGSQGKFYDMLDLLFETQDSWTKEPEPKNYFAGLAKKLSLNSDKFLKDLSSQQVKDKVDADKQSGDKANIDATPTFFLNGNKLDNIRSFDDFVNALKSVQ